MKEGPTWLCSEISSLTMKYEVVSLNQPLCKKTEINLSSIFSSPTLLLSEDRIGLTYFFIINSEDGPAKELG